MISVIFLLAQTKTLSRQQISDQTQNLSAFDLHLATDQKLRTPLGCHPHKPLTPSNSLVSVFCNAVVCQQIETSDLSIWVAINRQISSIKSREVFVLLSRPRHLPGSFTLRNSFVRPPRSLIRLYTTLDAPSPFAAALLAAPLSLFTKPPCVTTIRASA
ncbi:uncharacterized protein QC761_105679 [Podospora bellae-mahoneyi]|uniref:Uncharacterized protein n=1 Tax=Podospora bellae-mahoneyi TaxID=2093777 RepID=A0ABR0FVE1_9PEZI|nr:hypothetical protein QC761_105679 [Podospora bellae-mahoneyi]